MNNLKLNQLNQEEKDILNTFESNKLKKSKNQKNEIKKARNAAKATLLKNSHISIRLSEKDLIKIKQKALKTGIPYQTLIGALIHQYAEDDIKIAI